METLRHISTHIEKTAGTSLQEFYMRYYGSKNVYIYSSDTDTLICANRTVMKARVNVIVDKIRLLSKQLGLTSFAHSIVLNHLHNHPENHSTIAIPKNCYLIHGHFVADKFDNLISNSFRTIVFRDPLDRAISHYKYWREAKGVTNHRIDIPFDEKMTFQEFYLVPCMQNFQTTALGKLEIKDFDLVGVTEQLDRFVDKFGNMRHMRSDFLNLGLRRLNISPTISSNSQFYDDFGFIKKFKSFNQLDYYNYNLALAMNNGSS